MKLCMVCSASLLLFACSPSASGVWEEPILLSGAAKEKFVESCEEEGGEFRVVNGSSSCIAVIFSSPRYEDAEGIWRESQESAHYPDIENWPPAELTPPDCRLDKEQ